MEPLAFDGSATSDRQCVNITILNDDLRESLVFNPQPEVFQVQLNVSDSNDAIMLGIQTAFIAIEDDDCKSNIFVKIWILTLKACIVLGPAVLTTCSEAGFSSCCFGFCLLRQANCWCDVNCYRRRDCCDDIQQTCPRGMNSSLIIVVHIIYYDIFLLSQCMVWYDITVINGLV